VSQIAPTTAAERSGSFLADERAVVVELTGEVDLSDRPRLARRLVRDLDGTRRIVVDASEVSFMDASILQLLTAVAHIAEQRGGTLVVVGDHPGLRRILQVTGFDLRVPVVATFDEALGLHRRGSR
jgi:anti-anti-sigma factor